MNSAFICSYSSLTNLLKCKKFFFLFFKPLIILSSITIVYPYYSSLRFDLDLLCKFDKDPEQNIMIKKLMVSSRSVMTDLRSHLIQAVVWLISSTLMVTEVSLNGTLWADSAVIFESEYKGIFQETPIFNMYR